MSETADLRAPGAEEALARPGDVSAFVREAADGSKVLHLLVEGVHCGGCIRKIERNLGAEPEVTQARLNFTTRRLTLAWKGAAARGNDLLERLFALGYRAVPYDPDRLGLQEKKDEKELLRCLAVAGFAAANVMLLSIGVWAGAFEGMNESTRGLLHWFSALIALPAILYAGRPFFHSAFAALSKGRSNMDVPISLAVLLAGGMSLFETIRGGEHAYFDSAVTLLFFLLIGRYLDRRARGQARSAAERLLAIRGEAVTLLLPGGGTRSVPADQVLPGMTVLVAAGERVAVDGLVRDGLSDLDASLITGESLPQPVGQGQRVHAGALNLTAPLTLEVTAVGEDTLLGEIVRLMEAAEQRKARYVELADRVARLYAPVVHLLAAAAFLGWLLFGGLAWQEALMIAVAVLIVTCPCALGLAVPAVQVIASGRLLRQGIILKSGSALERLAEADCLVFDKTGTLTLGRPQLVAGQGERELLKQAAGLAATSKHPLAQALMRAAPPVAPLQAVREEPGLGLSWSDGEGGEWRLGRALFCGVEQSEADRLEASAAGPVLWFARPGRAAHCFFFEDALRPDAREVVAGLRAEGFELRLLSGDRPAAVAAVARELGIERWKAGLTPGEKVAELEAMTAGGLKPLMVGDGLNDAPALAAAHVSISPTSAADISQTAADALFQGDKLAPVAECLKVAGRSGALVRQNFVLAIGYNFIAVPLALAGLVTPLIAAVCMSASSLLVTGNALRLALRRDPS
jgi:Cu2+-exporting ATPase